MKNSITFSAVALFLCVTFTSNAQEAEANEEAENDAEQTQSEEVEKITPTPNETTEDVFDPSEDISEDYAVPFPTDI